MLGNALGNSQNCKNCSVTWGESWEMEFDGNFNSCYEATFPGYTQTWMELVNRKVAMRGNETPDYRGLHELSRRSFGRSFGGGPGAHDRGNAFDMRRIGIVTETEAWLIANVLVAPELATVSSQPPRIACSPEWTGTSLFLTCVSRS
jgi:hypothetical protein